MNLSPLPIQKFFNSNGEPLVGGLLYTYTAGTTTKVATYTDSTGVGTNTNPIVLDYRGECRVWLDITKIYKFILSPPGDTDPPTKAIWTVDNIAAPISFADLTQQVIGLILYPRTAVEIAAGVTPTNYWYPPGNVLRYGADATGTADSTTAFNSAILTGYRVIAPKGSYLVTNVSVLSGTYIEGESSGSGEATKIFVGTNNAAAFRVPTSYAFYVTISNLHIAAASGVTNARGYLQDDKSVYSAYAHFVSVNTDASLSVGYEGFFITSRWQNCTDGYTGSPPGGQQHQFITSLPAAFGQGNQTNLCVVDDCKVFGATSGAAAAIDIGWGGRWTFSGGTDFEALQTRAIRARGILGGDVRDCWFENINAPDYIVYFDSITGQGCGTWEISNNEIVPLNLGGSGFLLPNATTVTLRSNTCFNIPASKVLVHPSYLANVTLIDNVSLSGAGAAGFINKLQEGETGSFTITATGLVGTVTGTAKYSYSNGTITLETPGISGTSNATTFTLTGLPVAIRPASSKGNFPSLIADSGTNAFGSYDISTGGVMSFRKSATATGADWTAAGTKTAGGTSTTYLLA
jgi:hypothetical protein